MFRNQIQLFVQRKLSNTLAMGLGGDVEVDDFRFCVLSVTERTLVIVYYAHLFRVFFFLS